MDDTYVTFSGNKFVKSKKNCLTISVKDENKRAFIEYMKKLDRSFYLEDSNDKIDCFVWELCFEKLEFKNDLKHLTRLSNPYEQLLEISKFSVNSVCDLVITGEYYWYCNGILNKISACDETIRLCSFKTEENVTVETIDDFFQDDICENISIYQNICTISRNLSHVFDTLVPFMYFILLLTAGINYINSMVRYANNMER